LRITSRKAVLGGLATLGAGALVLSGCASAPEDDGGSSGGGEAASDFLPCLVSDSGGFDDNSFNELSFNGIMEAGEDLGVEPITVESNSESDYAPNIDNLLGQGCGLIITVGFALSAATIEAAEANPDVDFAIIDDAADADFDGQTDQPNIKPILFNTAPAGFLAGYAAASYSETGVVATWGGQPFPTVTVFEDGFAQGVQYYNEETGEDVQVLGYDLANPESGTFTGGFEANDQARAVAQGFIDQNADVLLPVGGPIYQSAIPAIEESGRDIALIGVDADLYETDPAAQPYLLTSILKQIQQATFDVVDNAGSGDEFDTTPYIGTLENDGVGVAPFHDLEADVDPELGTTLEDLRQQIIDGDIEVTSYLD